MIYIFFSKLGLAFIFSNIAFNLAITNKLETKKESERIQEATHYFFEKKYKF
jgi:hypothetical protein